MILPRGYFHIVYSTYARLDSPAMVDRVFELFAKERSGNFSFEGEREGGATRGEGDGNSFCKSWREAGYSSPFLGLNYILH